MWNQTFFAKAVALLAVPVLGLDRTSWGDPAADRSIRPAPSRQGELAESDGESYDARRWISLE